MKNRVVSSLQESFVYVTALQSPACARTSPSTKRGALLPRLLAALPFLIASVLLTSCQKADDFYYTGARVSFTYTYTNTIPELNAALGSMGEFCTIRTDGQNFIFSGLKTTTTRPLTAADVRVHPALGLSGLIVGLPNIPDVGADVSRVVAFDLACPCYDDSASTRNLQLRAGGFAYCPRCQRTYNLNSQGIVADGQPGRALYRYRITYNAFGNTVSITN